MTQTTHVPPDETEDVEPGLRDALIGSGIGVLLIYLGTLIPYWFLRWSVLGLGVLFVVVMTSFVGVFLWLRIAPRVVPIVKRARGHVRRDPQLGTLTRDAKTECWTAIVPRGDRSIELVIAGKDEPDSQLLASARTLFAGLETLERRVEEYLAEAARVPSEDPDIAAEIAALRLSSIKLWSAEQPDRAIIDFDITEEERYWSCVWEHGQLSDLDFD